MIRIKGKGITSLIMALVLSSAAVVPVLAQEISLIENTQKEIREIEVDLEVGETFHDPETGISIKRLPDNYDGRESKPLTRAYSKDLWDEDLTDKDFNGNYGLDGWAACRIADSKAGLDLR